MARNVHTSCLAVWDADPRCPGWNEPFGTVLHGCKKRQRHGDDHLCACGNECARGRDRIFPRYTEVG